MYPSRVPPRGATTMYVYLNSDAGSGVTIRSFQDATLEATAGTAVEEWISRTPGRFSGRIRPAMSTHFYQAELRQDGRVETTVGGLQHASTASR